MKPSTIYMWEPIKVTKDVWEISHFTDQENVLLHDLDRELLEKQERIEIKYYIDECTDGERTIELFSVWFDKKPVMICLEAGRSGRDHDAKFITDTDSYIKMYDFLRSLTLKDPEELAEDVVGIDDDIEELDYVYGNKISDLYDPEFKPMYKEGDIVLASVIQDHLRMAYINKKYVETRCQILSVNPHNPNNTYHMKQLDRRWETPKEIEKRLGKEAAKNVFVGEMVEDPGNGGIGAAGNDKTIIKLLERESND